MKNLPPQSQNCLDLWVDPLGEQECFECQPLSAEDANIVSDRQVTLFIVLLMYSAIKLLYQNGVQAKCGVALEVQM